MSDDCEECKERNDQYGFILHAINSLQDSVTSLYLLNILQLLLWALLAGVVIMAVIGCAPAPEPVVKHSPDHRTMWCGGSKMPEQTGQYIRNCNCRAGRGYWMKGGLSMDMIDQPEEDGVFCEGCDIGLVWSCAERPVVVAEREFNH